MKYFALLVLLFSLSVHSADEDWLVTKSVSGDWYEVNEVLQELIAQEGIVISFTSHAYKFLERTKDLGGGSQVYQNAQIHLFCKTDISHEMTQSNPHHLGGCPYSIAVYELKTKPNTIYLSYRSNQYPKVLKLLDDIVNNTIDEVE